MSLQSKVLEPKQAVLEGKINYVKIWIKGKLELVCCQWNTYRSPEKNSWTRTSLRMLTLTNFDETTEEKKEDLDDSLSNSSFGK